MQTIQIRPERLASLRRLHDLRTQRSLAEALRINEATVSRVLADQAAPGTSFIAAALRTFDVPFEYLFEAVDQSPADEVALPTAVSA